MIRHVPSHPRVGVTALGSNRSAGRPAAPASISDPEGHAKLSPHGPTSGSPDVRQAPHTAPGAADHFERAPRGGGDDESIEVFVCLRPTRFGIPFIDYGAKLLGKQHMWIETGRFSYGMAGGRNRTGDSRGHIFSTEVVDHSSEWERTDIQIERVRAEAWVGPDHPPIDGGRLHALFEDMKGKTLGTYVPYWNDCETFVRTMLRLAAVSKSPEREIAKPPRDR